MTEINTETETNFRILPIYFFFGITNVNVGGKILLSVGRKHTHFFFGLSMIAGDLVEIKLQKT
jgi:hypothetical protein